MPGHPRWVRRFISPEDLDAVARAVKAVEQTTSAEIRVHLDHRCAGDPMARAIALFEQLGMHRTQERNGILIYVAVGSRKLAVIGDTGIHERVGQDYWQAMVSATMARLQSGRPRAGLVEAVRDAGAALHAHFPRRPEDRNELSDDVSLA